MRVLVTGCAGFIGLNFTKFLLQGGNDYVIGVDKLTYASNVKELKKIQSERFIFYKCDVCSKSKIEKIFSIQKPDIVINFAAESHVDRSITSPDNFIKTNVHGVLTLLEACKRHNVRFHQVSTDEVYGDLSLDSDKKFSESDALNPSSAYSASKASADLLTLSYARTHDVFVTISRSCNNYGIYQHYEKFIPHTIINALAKKPITVYGNGLNVRDWMSVDDHVKAIDLIIKKGERGNVYNVGANNEISNIQLAKTIVKILGADENLITFVADRKGHDLKYSLDLTKIKNLGFLATADFNQELVKVIDYYKAR